MTLWQNSFATYWLHLKEFYICWFLIWRIQLFLIKFTLFKTRVVKKGPTVHIGPVRPTYYMHFGTGPFPFVYCCCHYSEHGYPRPYTLSYTRNVWPYLLPCNQQLGYLMASFYTNYTITASSWVDMATDFEFSMEALSPWPLNLIYSTLWNHGWWVRLVINTVFSFIKDEPRFSMNWHNDEHTMFKT